jgi:hypothetical protein
MQIEQKANDAEAQSEPTVFLKINVVFKDSLGELTVENATNVDISGNAYTLSIDQETNQLQISAVLKCPTYKKTITAFLELPSGATICMDTEENQKIKAFFYTHYFGGITEIHRLFRLLRWKYMLGSSELKHLSENISWSIDMEVWNPVVRCFAPENLRVTMINKKPLDTVMIKQLMETGKAEPIFLELLREANSISYSNLRSAFVIAVSALEVAVKYLIKNHAPITEWLVDEIPSPPIEKIINDFFPKLICGFTLTDDQKNTLKSVVSIRNKMVHSGQITNERKTLFKMMNFINDFILHTINPNLK